MPKTNPGEALKWVSETAKYRGDDCIVWPFGKSSKGYGNLWVEGRSITASRYMCIVVHGNPPTEKHQAAHRCGNGHLGCMTPGHLRWRTAKENAAEKVDHDTHQRGGRNAFTKLDEAAVLRIRARADESTVVLGREFGVAPATITDVLNRKTWAWV